MHISRLFLFGEVAGVFTAFCLSLSHAAEYYQVTDLGRLPGYAVVNPGGPTIGYTTPVDINNAGQIVGYCSYNPLDSNTPVEGAFLYQDGTLQPLGVLSGYDSSRALAVSDTGEIVGLSFRTEGGIRTTHAVRFTTGDVIDLGTDGGWRSSTATGVNASGIIVGGLYNSDPTIMEGAIHISGAWSPIGNLSAQAPYARPTAINDTGVIVGDADFVSPAGEFFEARPHAFRYQNGAMEDLGTFGGTYSGKATAINSDGQIVGYSFSLREDVPDTTVPLVRPILFENGQSTIIGNFQGDASAADINNHGAVVGNYDRPTGGSPTSESSPWVYEDGVVTYLNEHIDPEWRISYVTAINDAGQIVGYGFRVGDWAGTRGFLLTPSSRPTPTPTPTPGPTPTPTPEGTPTPTPLPSPTPLQPSVHNTYFPANVKSRQTRWWMIIPIRVTDEDGINLIRAKLSGRGMKTIRKSWNARGSKQFSDVWKLRFRDTQRGGAIPAGTLHGKLKLELRANDTVKIYTLRVRK